MAFLILFNLLILYILKKLFLVKIKRFNENIFYDTDIWGNSFNMSMNSKISKDAYRHIKDISYSINTTPLDWIEDLIKSTNLYKNYDLKKIANYNNLSELKKFIKERKEFINLQDKLEDLKNEISKSYVNGINELLYKFEEDLLKNDFENFYKLFIEGWENNEMKKIGYDIHPEIYKKYKKEIKNNIKLYKNTKKYNL